MAEAKCNCNTENGMEMNAIGSANCYQLGLSSSDSEREETEDIVGSLTEVGDRDSAGRNRTRTCCSTCSCSGTLLWQPPEDPSSINMLDVP